MSRLEHVLQKVASFGKGRIDALARKIGLHRTTLRHEMMDFDARARGEENTTSASDTAAFMVRPFALGLLLGQRPTSGLPIMLPAGARYAHKTGQPEGVENDAGIVLLPDRTFALAVLVQGDVGRAAEPVSSATETILVRWTAL